MTIRDDDYPDDIFERFHPICLIEKEYREQLSEKAVITPFKSGKTVIKKAHSNLLLHFLINGSVEVRHSFDNREPLSSDQEDARNPLEEKINCGGTIRATSDCKILTVNADFVDNLLTSSENSDYKIVHLSEYEDVFEEQIICDDFHEDWSDVFCRSPMASQLPANRIQQLFTNLEDIQVVSGETIVECQTPGDCFYIIKEGFANIVTEETGAFRGDVIELTVGDYFGDEALISDSMRNASVIITSDGILGRLSAEVFDDIVRGSLILSTADAKVNHQPDDPKYCYIDVRFPIEYNHGHKEGSKNIPVSSLRKNLSGLDREKTYIITSEGGRRSELATYLLRQSGYEAYYMEEHIASRLSTQRQEETAASFLPSNLSCSA